jgi:hypothetical protein
VTRRIARANDRDGGQHADSSPDRGALLRRSRRSRRRVIGEPSHFLVMLTISCG